MFIGMKNGVKINENMKILGKKEYVIFVIPRKWRIKNTLGLNFKIYVSLWIFITCYSWKPKRSRKLSPNFSTIKC